MHIDRHLARPGVARRRQLPSQRVETTELLAGQRDPVRARRPTRRQATPQAEDMAPGRSPDDLGFRALRRQLAGEPLGAFRLGQRRRKVDQMQRQPRHLVEQNPRKTPQRSTREAGIGRGVGLLSAARHQP